MQPADRNSVKGSSSIVACITTGVRYLAALVFAVNLSSTSIWDTPPQDPRDSRTVKLETFFKSYNCPEPFYTHEYIRAADTHGVDYRLLPALSVRESTCGRHDRKNNRWGWDSARRGFASVPRGIEYVARKLSQGRYYKDKTLDEKLYAYNPFPRYVREVKELMREIDE